MTGTSEFWNSHTKFENFSKHFFYLQKHLLNSKLRAEKICSDLYNFAWNFQIKKTT